MLSKPVLFALITAAGFCGGLLWIVTQIIGTPDPGLEIKHFLYALGGGWLAAGLYAYTGDDPDTTKPEKMFFLSMLAALSFPSIVSNATNAEVIGKKRVNASAVDKVADAQTSIAEAADRPEALVASLEDAKSKVERPSVDAEVREALSDVSVEAVRQLEVQATMSQDPERFTAAIEQVAAVDPRAARKSIATLGTLAASEDTAVSEAATQSLNRLRPTVVMPQRRDEEATAPGR